MKTTQTLGQIFLGLLACLAFINSNANADTIQVDPREIQSISLSPSAESLTAQYCRAFESYDSNRSTFVGDGDCESKDALQFKNKLKKKQRKSYVFYDLKEFTKETKIHLNKKNDETPIVVVSFSEYRNEVKGDSRNEESNFYPTPYAYDKGLKDLQTLIYNADNNYTNDQGVCYRKAAEVTSSSEALTTKTIQRKIDCNSVSFGTLIWE